MMTRAHFNEQLCFLQDKMLEMATFTDTMISQAVESLMTGNLELAREVVRRDDVVDRLDLEIEQQCLELIATQQPVARDLRIIGSAIKVITDVERIGDYAVDIAKVGRRLVRAEQIYIPIVDLPLLTKLTRTMLLNSLQAFVHHDLDLVEKVILDDDEVDALYHTMRDDLTEVIRAEPSRSLLALNLLFAAKHLERISDHVVNIAERVYFIETGELRQLCASHMVPTEPATGVSG